MVSVSDEREDEVFLLIRLQRKKCWVNRTELQLRGDRLGHRAHRGDAGERGKTLSCCRVYISFELTVITLCESHDTCNSSDNPLGRRNLKILGV